MNAAYHRSPHVLWRGSASRIVLLGPGSQNPLVMTGAGAALWEVLEQPVTLDGAATHLAGRYEVSEEKVAGDIRPLLDELVALQVVQRVEDQP